MPHNPRRNSKKGPKYLVGTLQNKPCGTGHNFLGKHQNIINCNISKVCRFCNEETETFHHFITECPSLRQLRTDIFFDKPFPADNTWSINKVKLFMREPIIYNTLISKSGLTEIEREPHEIQLPSDTDSSLQITTSQHTLLQIPILYQVWGHVGFSGHRGGLH